MTPVEQAPPCAQPALTVQERTVLAAIADLAEQGVRATPVALQQHLANHHPGFLLRPGTARIYPRLFQLEQYGLVDSEWTTGPVPRPRLYKVSEAGRGELEKPAPQWHWSDNLIGSLAALLLATVILTLVDRQFGLLTR